MDNDQIEAIKCAYADLIGAMQAYRQGQSCLHSWDAHRQSIIDLENAFGFIEPVDFDEE